MKEIAPSELLKNFIVYKDLYVKDKSNQEIILQKSGEILDIRKIVELTKEKRKILVTQTELDIHHKIILSKFDNYSKLYSIRDLIVTRNEIGVLFLENFCYKKYYQSEINFLGWKIFGNLENRVLVEISQNNSEFFIVSFSIASTMVFILFFVGFYNFNFLKNLFNEILDDHLSLYLHSVKLGLNPNDLTRWMFSSTISANESKVPSEFLASISTKNRLINYFEKLDGTGPKKHNMWNQSNIQQAYLNISSEILSNKESHFNYFYKLFNNDSHINLEFKYILSDFFNYTLDRVKNNEQ